MRTTAGIVAIIAVLSAAPALAWTGDTANTTTGPAGETVKNTGKPPASRTDNARPSSTQAEHSGIGGGATEAMGKQGTGSGQTPRPSASGGYPAQQK
ncbi:MAG TPA: hypothetical protein VFL96_05190 [Acidobacteriaceae bacterium]|nr:hypothetical protein [Acidobacteriaceae bacterium]